MTNLRRKQIQTHNIENGLVVAKGERGCWRGMEWQFGVSRCKLLYKEWKNNRSYCIAWKLYQYPVINHNGKEYEKECTYMYNLAVNTTL